MTPMIENNRDVDKRCWKVAFVNTHPIQYFAPLYAYLTSEENFEITALYLSNFSLRDGYDKGFGKDITWDIDLLKGYVALFMGKASSSRRLSGYFSMIAPELWGAIKGGRYDAVVIHGHNLAAHQVALAAALASSTPVFYRSETHLNLRRPAWKVLLRTAIISRWLKAFDGYLAIGSANKQYYESMGIEADQIYSVPYAVDNDRFLINKQMGQDRRTSVRERLGIQDDSPAILFCGKFDKRKHPDDLLMAFKRLQAEGIRANLVLAGSGEMEKELNLLVMQYKLTNVSFPGFINQTELPDVYAACEVFVLPSENEPWGLAVNEAMCAGLSIVVSEEVGCAKDLVSTRVNGGTFPSGDIDALTNELRLLLINEEYRNRCGKNSLQRIQGWSYRQCAAGLRAAVEEAWQKKSKIALGS